MTTEQKLREALQAISHIDDTTNHSVDASAALDRIGQIARQALAQPADGTQAAAYIENGVLVHCTLPVGFTGPLYTTPPASQEPKRINEVDLGPLKAELTDPEKAKAFLRNAGILNERDELTEAFGGKAEPAAQDHIPDAGEMVNGLTKAETDASASVSGLTGAPVGEREAFEREMRCEEEWGHRSLKKRQNGQYENWQVDLMWAVWQARAAQAAKAVPNPWRDAVIEQLESWHIYVPAIHENSPRLAIKALVNIETQTALDPKVSSQAAALAAGAVPDERDKVDAERFRGLLALGTCDSKHSGFSAGDPSKAKVAFRYWCSRDEAVDLIDAAIAARKGGAA